MRNRIRLVLFGLLLFTIFGGLVILSTIISRNKADATRQASINAIYLTNTVVAGEIDPCDWIATTLKISHVCGNWYDGWTATPSPTNPSLPTPNLMEAIGTAIQRTQQAHGTVLAACATLKVRRQGSNIDPCPTIWAAMTPAWNTIAPSVTPTPSTR
jgi:hypothetical protein